MGIVSLFKIKTIASTYFDSNLPWIQIHSEILHTLRQLRQRTR